MAQAENHRTDEPITAERIERALVLLALIISNTGETQYEPILDRLEKELTHYRQERDPMSRARRILQDHAIDGKVLKAIL